MTGIFKNRYTNLNGSDWVRWLTPEDLQFFVHMGLAASDYGKLGGKARAAIAQRDNRGRFIKKGSADGNNPDAGSQASF